MRGAWSVLLVISLGAAITMYQTAGAASALGLAENENLESDEALETQSDNVGPNQGINGSASQQEGSIVGLIVGGAQVIFTFLGAVVLLPFEMQNLGFPRWFAYPVGLVLQAHSGIAGIQFALNRRLE